MSTIRSAATAALLLSLFIASATASVAQDDGEEQASPPDMQPFAAVLTGSVSFEPLEAPTEECPFGVRTITDATGGSTLGEVSLHAEHCATPGLPSAPDGVQSLTTVDGEELSGRYFVDCDPVLPSAPAGESITCVGRFEITGGTGPFAGAVGMAHQTAFVWFPGSFEAQDWPWVSALEGTIAY